MKGTPFSLLSFLFYEQSSLSPLWEKNGHDTNLESTAHIKTVHTLDLNLKRKTKLKVLQFDENYIIDPFFECDPEIFFPFKGQ